MKRHFESDGIVLKFRAVGEAHRSVQILTPEKGILSVMVHGAEKNKSRFKPYTQPFTGVRVKIYHDPVKESNKVVDLQPRYQTPQLTSDLSKIVWANIWAETLFLSSAGGGDPEVFYLFDHALPLLDQAEDGNWIALQSIWRFHQSMGWGPDLNMPEGSGDLLYVLSEEHLVPSLSSPVDGIPVLRGSVAFLCHTLELDFKEAIKVRAGLDVLNNMKNWIFRSLEYHLDRKLKTLSTLGNWFFS